MCQKAHRMEERVKELANSFPNYFHVLKSAQNGGKSDSGIIHAADPKPFDGFPKTVNLLIILFLHCQQCALCSKNRSIRCA